MGMTMVEKILAKATGQTSVKTGDAIEPKVDLAMSHENGALVLNQFREIYQGTGLEACGTESCQMTHLQVSSIGDLSAESSDVDTIVGHNDSGDLIPDIYGMA